MRILCRYLVEAASREMGVSVEAIRGRTRTGEMSNVRRVLYYATVEVGIPVSEMARHLGRDHSTLCKVISSKDLTDEQRRKIEAVKLTAEIVAREHRNRLKEALSMGVAA